MAGGRLDCAPGFDDFLKTNMINSFCEIQLRYARAVKRPPSDLFALSLFCCGYIFYVVRCVAVKPKER
jgi:hypothetical protein